MARKAIVSEAIMALLEERRQHAWTLEGIHAALTARGIAANFTSVFRAAEKLAADKHLHKVAVDDGRIRFELAGAHHDHLHCDSCGELVPVPCLVGNAAFATLEREMGIAIARHSLVLRGLCRDCRRP
ncbi:MAG: transcriptional repressor [Alphaproteobacteria bacterium]|nr:transcriptional repressor [Alphaproteobacteria bacterium]MBV9551416.1 transcriptional repressor [Alphaproteobacteria bacterium]